MKMQTLLNATISILAFCTVIVCIPVPTGDSSAGERCWEVTTTVTRSIPGTNCARVDVPTKGCSGLCNSFYFPTMDGAIQVCRRCQPTWSLKNETVACVQGGNSVIMVVELETKLESCDCQQIDCNGRR
uniref:DAN domain-containing protein n=1 Tax=Clytia hemisphaerica TaxID=252671 RepID=A0A7M5WR80_9CNID